MVAVHVCVCSYILQLYTLKKKAINNTAFFSHISLTSMTFDLCYMSVTHIYFTVDMEESSDLYDAYETNGPPLWADHQHHCAEDMDSGDYLRRKIKYFFMNPCEKYHARGRKPWKLILQIIKIAIITVQVVISDKT